MGRPSKLTPELQEAICAPIREHGMFRRRAAALVGIPEVTISEWYTRGAREESGRYHEFYLAISKAEADFQSTCTQMLKAGSAGNPQLLLKWLARRFPEEYGRQDNVEVVSVEDRAAQAQAARNLLFERLERLFPPSVEAEIAPHAPDQAALPEGPTGV
jgi:hypothetical protein